MNKERTPAIWALNALGLVVFFGGLMKFLSSHQPWWMTFTFFGVFMVAVRIPRVYPKKLFVFGWEDLILPALLVVFLIFPMEGVGLVYKVSFAVGLSAISFGARAMINLSDRLGSWMAGGRTLADE